MNRNAAIPIVRNDPKVVRGWVMYDWANSVYQLTIASTIFPIYFNSVTHTNGSYTVSFFGYEIVNTVLYSWSIAVAYLLVAVLSPLLSSFADYTGRRRAFMKAFTLIGSVSCGALFFFNKNTIELGTIAFTLGTIGYGGSIVFYNSFPPVIASEDMQDRIKQVSEICNTNAERLAAAERAIELQTQTNQDVKADLMQIRKDITTILVILQDKKNSNERYER